MSAYGRGTSREYRTMRELEKRGYHAHRIAGSHGEWDIIGIPMSAGPVLLIQVKLNCLPGKEEMKRMREYQCDGLVFKKELWQWKTRKGFTVIPL